MAGTEVICIMAEASLLRKFDNSGSSSLFSGKMVVVLIIVALLGVVTGYMLVKKGNLVTGTGPKATKTAITSDVKKGDVFGVNDPKTDNTSAEGTLEEGGIDGEGQFHLVRPGGESQYVYLVSSTVDLSKLLKRKVKVWGQTHAAQKAGWLMDVGKVEVLE